MIPASFAGLLVAALAILPGAVYVWSYERQVGAFNVAATDRLVRFLGVSAGVQFVAAWPEYVLFRLIRSQWPNIAVGQFALAWGLLGLVVLSPGIAGTIVGRRVRNGSDFGQISQLLGRPEQPTRAWDYLFMRRDPLYVRVLTTSGTWVAGVYAEDSYAAGPPTDGDLFLEQAWTLVEPGRCFGEPIDESVYVAADKIEYMEIQQAKRKES